MIAISSDKLVFLENELIESFGGPGGTGSVEITYRPSIRIQDQVDNGCRLGLGLDRSADVKTNCYIPHEGTCTTCKLFLENKTVRMYCHLTNQILVFLLL